MFGKKERNCMRMNLSFIQKIYTLKVCTHLRFNILTRKTEKGEGTQMMFSHPQPPLAQTYSGILRRINANRLSLRQKHSHTNRENFNLREWHTNTTRERETCK